MCNERAASTSPTFPLIETVGGVQRATIGPLSQGADDIVFGWDSHRNEVIEPRQTFELLSYCGAPRKTPIGATLGVARWISTYTNSLVRTFIEANFRRRALELRRLRTSRKLLTSFTVVRAVVDMDSMTTRFLPAFQVGLPSIPPASSSGYVFDPIELSQDIESPGGSTLQVSPMYVQAFVRTPPTGMVASMQVEQGGSVIGDAQSNTVTTPTVTVIFPNGVEVLSGISSTISWSSADSHGDTLSYFVLFSPDNGAT